MKKLSLIGLFVLVAMTLSAETAPGYRRGLHASDSISPFGRGLFRYAPFGHSLYADVHPNLVRLDVPYGSNNKPYDWGDHANKYRWGILGLFGFNLPIWYGNIVDPRFAISVTMASSANLWMDLFDFRTSPIVDTDYRVGAPTFTFIHRLNKGALKNYSVAWSPFKHESTHIGDELQIKNVERGYALKRVNPSYNYTEFVFTLNEAEDRYAENHCVRVGLMLLWGGHWYNIDPWDGEAPLATPRYSPWELYLQYQYQSPTSKHGFQGVASAEIRNRVLYGYDLTALKTDPNPDKPADRRVFTFNIFMGARYNMPNYDGYFSRVALGVRMYHGNCPYGQFRSIANYNQIGASLIFE